jgi:hypothetical protein
VEGWRLWLVKVIEDKYSTKPLANGSYVLRGEHGSRRATGRRTLKSAGNVLDGPAGFNGRHLLARPVYRRVDVFRDKVLVRG